MHSDPVIVSRALEVGATGYVLKDTSSDEVVKAFQRVRENRPYLSHDLASEVAFMEARGTTNPLRRMTVRELQTLALIAEGKPYGVIAEHLHVSYKTVANTCTQLKAKLGVRTLPELMRIAIQHLPSATAKPSKRMDLRRSIRLTEFVSLQHVDVRADKLRAHLCGTRRSFLNKLDAVQRRESRFGTFYCREHFSLAKPLHLAIMSGQLSNGWDAGSIENSITPASNSELSCDSS